MKIFKVEAAFGLGLYLLAAFVFLSAKSYPHVDWEHGGSPGFYPEILVVLLVIFATIMVWFGFKNTQEPEKINKKKIIDLCITVLVLLITPKLFKLFGFLAAAVPVVFILMLAFQGWKTNRRKLIEAVLASIIGTAIIFIVFQYGAKVVLPRGTLF